jgi:hypothetical protein
VSGAYQSGDGFAFLKSRLEAGGGDSQPLLCWEDPVPANQAIKDIYSKYSKDLKDFRIDTFSYFIDVFAEDDKLSVGAVLKRITFDFSKDGNPHGLYRDPSNVDKCMRGTFREHSSTAVAVAPQSNKRPDDSQAEPSQSNKRTKVHPQPSSPTTQSQDSSQS